MLYTFCVLLRSSCVQACLHTRAHACVAKPTHPRRTFCIKKSKKAVAGVRRQPYLACGCVSELSPFLYIQGEIYQLSKIYFFLEKNKQFFFCKKKKLNIKKCLANIFQPHFENVCEPRSRFYASKNYIVRSSLRHLLPLQKISTFWVYRQVTKLKKH